MKYISPLFSEARNKLGGTVFARNRSGPYTRARVAPVQPRTPNQQANRAGFQEITQAWRGLTVAERLTWNAAAPTITLKDTIGQSFNPSGFQLFVSCNRNLAPTGRPLQSKYVPAETSFDLLGPLVLDYEQAGGVVSSMTFDTSNDRGHGDTWISVYCTGPLGPGISFVQPHLHRYIYGNTDDNLSFDITAGWSNQFGTALPAGSQISTVARQIDIGSGFVVFSWKAITVIA